MQSGDGSLSGRSDRERRLNLPGLLGWFGKFFLAILAVYLLAVPRHESDTGWLIYEASKELSCLLRGQWSGCGDVASHYPLFQVGPAMLLTWLGLSASQISWIFAYFSAACFVGSVWLIHRVLDRQSPWLARLGLLIYLAGYVLCYVHSSFTEMAAATLTLAVVACELLGVSPWLTAALLCIAALSKETSAPFLFFLATLAAATRLKPLRLAPLARRQIPVGLGAAVAIALHLAANQFKFGTFLNRKYLQPHSLVSDLGHQISFFLGQWFSPTSGVWLCWTSFAALFPVIAWRLAKAHGTDRRRWLTLAGASALLLALTLGFSKWFAPFGWVAWGHRLMLPWIPAVLLLLLVDYASEIREAVSWLAQRPRRAGAVLSIFALSVFANFRVLINRSLASQVLDSPVCGASAIIESNPTQYYKCIEALIWPWPESWPLLKVYSLFPEPHAFILATIYCAGWLWFAKTALDEAKTAPQAFK